MRERLRYHVHASYSLTTTMLSKRPSFVFKNGAMLPYLGRSRTALSGHQIVNCAELRSSSCGRDIASSPCRCAAVMPRHAVCAF
jgi:hypothetical protein